MNTSHTPAPWNLTPTYSHVFVDTMKQGGVICKLPCRDSVLQWASEPGSLENSANAKLICAAPDLLDALVEMVQSFKDGSHYETMNPYSRPCVQKAIKAIARATGKDQDHE